MSGVFRYLTVTSKKVGKPNWESQLPCRFSAAHAGLQNLIGKTEAPLLTAKVKCIMPIAGLRDNTINRLLLMSSVDHYLDNVPMAFLVQPFDPKVMNGRTLRARSRMEAERTPDCGYTIS